MHGLNVSKLPILLGIFLTLTAPLGHTQPAEELSLTLINRSSQALIIRSSCELTNLYPEWYHSIQELTAPDVNATAYYRYDFPTLPPQNPFSFCIRNKKTGHYQPFYFTIRLASDPYQRICKHNNTFLFNEPQTPKLMLVARAEGKKNVVIERASGGFFCRITGK